MDLEPETSQKSLLFRSKGTPGAHPVQFPFCWFCNQRNRGLGRRDLPRFPWWKMSVLSMLPEDTGHRFCWKSKLPKRKIAYVIWFGQQLRSAPPRWKDAGGSHHPGQEVPSLCAGKHRPFQLPAPWAPHTQAGCSLWGTHLSGDPGVLAGESALLSTSFTKLILKLSMVGISSHELLGTSWSLLLTA